jgi:hypothetical protein
MATNINKIILSYQPCQLVKNRCFRDQLHPHHEDYDIIILMMGMELVSETSIFNQLTWLIAQEDFINTVLLLEPGQPSNGDNELTFQSQSFTKKLGFLCTHGTRD